MALYSQNPLQIAIRELQSSPTSATNVKQSWSAHTTAPEPHSAVPAPTPRPTAPENLVNTKDAVILSQVTYAKKPLVPLHEEELRQFRLHYTLSDNIDQKPRGQWPVLLQSAGTSRPPPTFR